MYLNEKIKINKLRPHPRNKEIYGTDEINDLVERIKVTKRIEPIKITPNGIIISGHRRVKAAIALGYQEIDCFIVNLDSDQQLELLLDENCYREKTNIQKIREGIVYQEIESKKSEQRKIESGKKNLGLPVVETDTTTDNTGDNEKGKTRDIVGKKLKISGKTFEKGVKIIKRIDQETDKKIKSFLSEQTNNSIDSTHKLVGKSSDFIKKVMETYNSTGNSIGKIIKQVEMNEKIDVADTNPDNLFELLYMVVKQGQRSLKKLFDIPVSKITNENSSAWVWVIPSMVEEITKVLNSWGFSFLICDSWEDKNCETRNPFTGDGIQILCVFTKGKVNKENLEHIYYRLKKNHIDPYVNTDQFNKMIESEYATKSVDSFECENICDIWGL